MTGNALVRKLVSVVVLGCVSAFANVNSGDSLKIGFQNPPRSARMHCYWWWLNGNTDETTITRDLEQMKAKGYGGVILIDANGSNQGGNENVPAGPTFGTPAWRKLYRHAIREAARLHLEISLTIQSGWNLGGPSVRPEQASKLLTFSREIVDGPATIEKRLAEPPRREGFYRDIAVLAYPLHAGRTLPGTDGDGRRPIRLLREKAAFKEVMPFSMPVTTQLLEDDPAQPNEEDARLSEVQDVTAQVKSGELTWNVPAGVWEILRVGYTDSGAEVSTSSAGWKGLAIDYLDRAALETYWKENVAPLISDAQPYVGKALRYLVTDSWELGGTNWTARFREEFQKRRGYDALRYLPVVSGRIVESRENSDRFLNDFRKTIGELIVEEHYAVFAQLAARAGLGIHPESGGPHGAPLDALRTLGVSTFPQTEFWAQSATHRSSDEDRFFVKEASSAAHIYGKTIVAGEGMTSIGPQWEESIWNDLKPTFDQAVCAGLNLLFWHTFTSSPKSAGVPGQEYFAGTHLNPNVTWWNQAGPFIAYINRTQFLMQEGVPVADVLYYYGDWVPNFVRLKASDPAKVLPGYDYDVTDEDMLVHGAKVEDGRIVLPGGMTYRLLAIGNQPSISLSALRKIRQLVWGGATVTGQRPRRTTGLEDSGKGDAEVQKLANEIWGDCGEGGVTVHLFGRGRVFCDMTPRDVLLKENIPPDFEAKSADNRTVLDYVHRRAAGTDIYFVRNTRPEAIYAQMTMRVGGKAPELWHADTGGIETQPLYARVSDGRTAVPVWLEPFGSVCVVFRRASTEHLTALARDGAAVFPLGGSAATPAIKLRGQRPGGWTLETTAPGEYEAKTSAGATLRTEVAAASDEQSSIDGNWTVRFPAGRGAPSSVLFRSLQSWTANADPGIRYFSGTATYSKEIDVPAKLLAAARHWALDLGEVREIAHVTVNGRDLGIAWKKPFLVRLDGALKPGPNQFEIAVTNLWPNRLIGDRQLPIDQRFTRTNITKFRADSPLLPSGLLGPVRLIPIFTGVLDRSSSGNRTILQPLHAVIHAKEGGKRN